MNALILILLAICASTSAVLTGYENRDQITINDAQFQCNWLGGTAHEVNCTCREDAEEMYVKKNWISPYDSGSTASIVINRCKRVKFGPQVIADMRSLRKIVLQNIPHLEFEEASLFWQGYSNTDDRYDERLDLSIPALKILVENSRVIQISKKTFEGRISEIKFVDSTIETIKPFAFTSLKQTQNVIFKNVTFQNVETQAFKKFTTENLELDRVKAEVIPSRFFSDVSVNQRLIIKRCEFQTLRPGAFVIQKPIFIEISDSTIRNLDGEAFTLTTRGDVTFKNNIFDVIYDGAFRGITLDKEEASGRRPLIKFESNHFSTLTRDSLTVSEDFDPKFLNLKINETCDCDRIDHNIKDASFFGEILCLNGENSRDFVTVEDFKANACSIIRSFSTTIVIVGVVITLLFLVATVLVFYYRRVYLSREYGSKKSPKKTNNVSMIVPDGRTYRETELHVIVERADLLTTDL